MKTLKILVSAYACRPGEGSEPAISWNLVRELSKSHHIWVLTRSNNRPALEAELNKNLLPDLHIIYCDLPQWLQQLNQGQRLVQIHYYFWQIVAYFVARHLHREIGFDLVHHVTYVKYWSPSFLSLLPLPFIWGPVGGGESAPKAFWKDFSLRGRVYEVLRDGIRRCGEFDPFVYLTAHRSAIAFATTEATAQRLRRLGASKVQVLSQLGLPQEELAQLKPLTLPSVCGVRFVSIGRLLHWKGFHLGLRAFAQANLPENAEYWILGDGPERKRLQSLAQNLGISAQVKFWGNLSRPETLQKLQSCLALIHPSLHDSGGMVCLEALATGRPAICLDLGGPALQVTQETGFKIPAQTPEQAVRDLAAAMTQLAQEPMRWADMGQTGQKRVREIYNWERKSQFFSGLYEEILKK